MISSFDKEYAFLSNFYICPVEYEGVVYPSAEAAFQAAKTLDPAIRDEFSILSPSQAKRKGRHLELRPHWEEIKRNVMLSIVRNKFKQNKDLAAKLLETDPEYLEEGNTWHDNTWGVCKCSRCQARDQVGLNWLGKALMKVREELRVE